IIGDGAHRHLYAALQGLPSSIDGSPTAVALEWLPSELFVDPDELYDTNMLGTHPLAPVDVEVPSFMSYPLPTITDSWQHQLGNIIDTTTTTTPPPQQQHDSCPVIPAPPIDISTPSGDTRVRGVVLWSSGGIVVLATVLLLNTIIRAFPLQQRQQEDKKKKNL
ncbi:hypothetical protein FOZ62_007147, partial [Perkinsus olseni]